MKYIKIDIVNNLQCFDYKILQYLSTRGISVLMYHGVVTSFVFMWVVFTGIGFYFIWLIPSRPVIILANWEFPGCENISENKLF